MSVYVCVCACGPVCLHPLCSYLSMCVPVPVPPSVCTPSVFMSVYACVCLRICTCEPGSFSCHSASTLSCCAQVMRLIRLAEQKAKQLSEMLQASLKKHDVERVQARIRRHNHTPSAPQLQGRAVTVLNSSDVIGWSHHQIGISRITVHACQKPQVNTLRHELHPVVTSASMYSCCQCSS